jgi:hypothetical protein
MRKLVKVVESWLEEREKIERIIMKFMIFVEFL